MVVASLNAWYYTVITYDGSVLKIYVDGVLKNSYNNPTLSSEVGSATQIGAIYFQSGQNRSFKGLIDEPRIYNRALSAEEIKRHYEMSK
jgi:hypothetical protein